VETQITEKVLQNPKKSEKNGFFKKKPNPLFFKILFTC